MLGYGCIRGRLNNDGWPDLLVTCFGGVVLYRNNGDGTFTDVSRSVGASDPQNRFGLPAVWPDFDQDGHLDLFVTNDGQPNYLYRNDGSGHFKDVAFLAGVAVSQDGVEQANMGVALGDYLHTGRFSIVITHFSDEYAVLYRNDGGMNFVDESYASGIAPSTTAYVGWGDGFIDWRNTGWPDLFMVNGHVYPQVDTADVGTKYRQPMLLFENLHNGKFKDISQLVGSAIQVPRVGRGVAYGDLFNDGRIDIVVENLKGEPVILQPQGLPPNHWVSFELEGTQSNRLALNARVRTTAGDLVQTGEVVSSGSYLSQPDLRLHFGLGSHDQVGKADVTWPSGKVEALTNLAADHFYKVKEGKGIISSEPPRSSEVNHR